MDMEALTKGIGLFGTALSTAKQIIAMLPNSPKQVEAAEALERAEREFKIAEAEIASKLDYELCRNHFPPWIMLSKDGVNWQCDCGNTIDQLDGWGRVS
jgi:hypothetical protein